MSFLLGIKIVLVVVGLPALIWLWVYKRCLFIGHAYSPKSSGRKLCVDREDEQGFSLVEMDIYPCQRSGCKKTYRIRRH